MDSRQKIYLEPRNQFDPCIWSETNNSVTYNVQEILVALVEEYKQDSPEADEVDLLLEATEWFDSNIEPLTHYYNINFFYHPEM